MKTEKIAAALRCSSQVPGPQMDCRICPYHMEETVDGVDCAGCDCDRIAVDAADRLEELVERCARYAEEIAVLLQVCVQERRERFFRNARLLRHRPETALSIRGGTRNGRDALDGYPGGDAG